MKKILIVEDNPNVIESLKDLLETSGYKPKCASNGEQALEILSSNYLPDLIISDIMMPGIDGYQLRNIISSKPDLSQIPFIFLTAKTQIDEIRKGMNSGADDYITKPYKASDLLDAIEIRLRKKESLEKKLDIITKNFAMYVPHELRTPLVSILGYASLMLSEKDEISKEEIFYMIERINGSAKRLHDTIEKFILFTELNRSVDEKEYLNLIQEPLSFGAESIIQSKAKEIAERYERDEDLQFDLEQADLPFPLILFSTAIKQLIDNAFKFSKRGEKISISSKKHENNYVIILKDEGIGISKENIGMIDAFVQFERTEHQQIGNGLGMVIARKIINSFNGRIEIESELKEYTKVFVTIPLHKIK